MKRLSINFHVALACTVLLCSGVVTLSSPPVAEAQEAPAVDATNITAKDLNLDTLEIPAGDAEALGKFIVQIGESAPMGESEAEQDAYAQKVLATILDAAARMRSSAANDDQKAMAQRHRLNALLGLSKRGNELARDVFAAALDATMNNPRPEIASVGWQDHLYSQLSKWAEMDENAKDALLARIVERAKSPHLSSLEVSIVYLVASNLERNDDPFVVKLLEQTVPTFEASESDEVTTSLAEANLRGMLRRLTLLGKPMEMSGELLGGGEIDWESYRGKVVLVDFTATWCEPCMLEATNVLAMYNAYKDKGFDVVAVSLDDTADEAEQFVKKLRIPWATLFSSKADEAAMKHPMARYYGIVGLPTAILVDQKGNAVHMNARADLLRSELRRLLGEPAKAARGS